jgi:hypothetical protein
MGTNERRLDMLESDPATLSQKPPRFLRRPQWRNRSHAKSAYGSSAVLCSNRFIEGFRDGYLPGLRTWDAFAPLLILRKMGEMHDAGTRRIR